MTPLTHSAEGALTFLKPAELWDKQTFDLATSELDYLLNRYSNAQLSSAKPSSYLARVVAYITFLVENVERYQKHKKLIKPSKVQDVVRFLLEQHGQSPDSIRSLLDHPEHESSFWRGRHQLSLAEAKRLHKKLGVPADLLLA